MDKSSTTNSAHNATASSTPPGGSLAGRAYRLTVRRVRGIRKQAIRGVKLGRHLFQRLRRAEKTLYFRLRDSEAGNAVLKAAQLARAPRESRLRGKAATSYLARLKPLSVATIDHKKGYGLLPPDSTGELSQVLATCRHVFELKKAHIEARLAGFDDWDQERKQKYLARKQSFLRYLLDDEDLRHHPDLVEWALSDASLGAATQYLGMVPYLSRVDLMYSLPRDGDDNIASQLFHLDYEGVTQVKTFVHVFDVDETQGPFTFIPADATARILRDIRQLRRRRRTGQDVESRRYSDDEIAAVGGRDDIVTVKGPAGAGVAIDTSRCLHLGSRVRPGAFRLCLYLQYCTTRELTNVFDVNRFKSDPTRHLAVKHSVEPGRAHAIDYTDKIMGS